MHGHSLEYLREICFSHRPGSSEFEDVMAFQDVTMVHLVAFSFCFFVNENDSARLWFFLTSNRLHHVFAAIILSYRRTL